MFRRRDERPEATPEPTPPEPTLADRVREVEEAIAAVRSEREGLETERDDLRRRVGEAGKWEAASRLGEIEATPEEVTRRGRETRERLREVEDQIREKLDAGHDLARRLAGLERRRASDEVAAASLRETEARLERDRRAADYRRADDAWRATAAAVEEARNLESAASLRATAVAAAIERGEAEPLAAVERERAERDRRLAADLDAKVRAIIRNPLLLAQSPHLREEVERRRPELVREAEERDALAERLGEARGQFRRVRDGEIDSSQVR